MTQGENLVGITKELDKKFLMYPYIIYITDTWSVLTINSLPLMSMY